MKKVDPTALLRRLALTHRGGVARGPLGRIAGEAGLHMHIHYEFAAIDIPIWAEHREAL